MAQVQQAATQGVGKPLRRSEDGRFLHGRGKYLADLHVEGMQEAVFVRSPVAHARIRRIEVPQGAAARVFTLADLGDIKPIMAVSAAAGYQRSNYPALATGKVRFVGEPIAICVAPTRAEAEDLAQQVLVDFEDLPAVTDMYAAREPDAPRVHDEWSDNVAFLGRIDAGDIDALARSADLKVSITTRQARQAAVPLEGRGVLAYRDHRLDELTVYSSTQFPHVIRTILADCLRLPERRLRVVAPDVGGGFGVKNNFQPEELALAALALRVDFPVRWVEDRREHLLASAHAREHGYKLIAYADRSGRILGIDAEITVDAGAYSIWPWTSSMEAGMASGILTGPYDIRTYRARAYTMATNKSPIGPYRGVGRPGACFAVEQLVDAVARAAGREPHEVRAENMVRPEQMPYVSVTKKHFDSGDYPALLRKAAEEIGVAQVRERQQRGEADGRLIGVGFASYTEQSAHGTDEWVARGLPVVFGYEPCTARFTPDGELVLLVGIQNHGQGLETTLAQVANQELTIDPRRVAVRHGDSSLSPYGMGTFASRSMVMAGGAVAKACREMAQKVKRIGAHLLGTEPGVVSLRDGAVWHGDKSVPFARVAEAAFLHPERLPKGEAPGLDVTVVYEPGCSTGAFAYATHAAMIAVDPDTGLVEILDYVAAHDCGTVVNPMIVEHQVIGGVAQGIGSALFEEIPYDEQGQPLASTFMDYLLPGAAEVPRIRVFHTETPSPHTTYGMKGMGEGGAIAPPAAILNAINDALRTLGAELRQSPCSPRRIVAAIRAGAGGRK
ncbi:MAG: xanthine dehydrogenase family protein molybdopterin-binding subunit [Acidobacteriota bacterium]